MTLKFYLKLMFHINMDWQLLPMVKRTWRVESVFMDTIPEQWPTIPRDRNGFPSTGIAYKQMFLLVENIKNFE